jgi:hypothetical protein
MTDSALRLRALGGIEKEIANKYRQRNDSTIALAGERFQE